MIDDNGAHPYFSYIFVLPAFVGIGLISNVSWLLHPLLFVLNAISGLTLVISMGYRPFIDEFDSRNTGSGFGVYIYCRRAAAKVSEKLLLAMDKINDEFKNTDGMLVIGANDIIIPAPQDQKNRPLSGRPTLNVGNARSVIICTRSLSPDFSGAPNDLFYDEGTLMLPGDDQNTLTTLIQLLKQ